ncbi:MAG: hypothetical protein K1000chlam4_00036 [Chlamydiae bacterium]|nr:hypothetical protein [Chlamydiota bacterium]
MWKCNEGDDRIQVVLIKKFLLLFFCLGWSLSTFAAPLFHSEEEEFFARRIIDLWQDKEHDLAVSQIRLFIEEFPESPWVDHCYSLLGDIALNNKRYKDALAAFEKIHSEELKKNLHVKRWHALYQLKLYTQLFEEIAPHASRFSEKDEEGRFYYAESCFREALTLLNYEEGKEQARALCEEALPYYTQLVESPLFGLSAKMALAEIHRLLDSPAEAVSLYLSLADELQNEKGEEILFHAGMVLAEFDQDKALEIFARLARSGQEKSSEAAGMWFYLLAKKQAWDTLVQEKKLLLSRLSDEKKALCHFYLGKTFFDRKEYGTALEHFDNSLDLDLKTPHDKTALLSLMICSKKMNDMQSMEKGYALFKKRFGKKALEIGKVTLLRAQVYRDSDEKAKALALFDKIIGNQWAEQEQAYHARVRLAITMALKEKNWTELASKLEKALADEEIFTRSEKAIMQTLLAESYLALGRYQTAETLLQDHLQRCGESAKTHALLAQCYLKDGADPEQPISHGERALQLNPGLKELHLPLFNAYLELAKTKPDENFEEKAAHHLYEGANLSPISLENRFWLANYYYLSVESQFNREKALRAIFLLEPLVEDPTHFDSSLVKLSALYEWVGDYEKAFSLLEKLSSPPAKLRLANLFHSVGKREKAMPLYQNLEELADLSVAGEARLQVARYLFASLSVAEKRVESPHMKEVLHRLNDLKLRKSLASEPIHLEAALDHAEFTAASVHQEERDTTLLKLLLKVKDEFTTEKDIWSKDYHSTRKLLPDQDRIYQAYMRYLDARIFLLQAKMAKREGKIVKGQSKEKAARALLSTLKQGKFALTKYLVEKATACSYKNNIDR